MENSDVLSLGPVGDRKPIVIVRFIDRVLLRLSYWYLVWEQKAGLTMPRSRAHIQKEYRELKKRKIGEEYKERERQRTKKYHAPTDDLDKIAQKKRRENVRLQVQSFRKTKKQQRRLAKKAEDEYMAADSHGLRSSNNPSNPSLPSIVDFDFQKGKKWPKTGQSSGRQLEQETEEGITGK